MNLYSQDYYKYYFPCPFPLIHYSPCSCAVYGDESVELGGKSACQAEMNQTEYCEGGVVLHPCCVGLLGDCVVTTRENCSFQRGHWHPDKVRVHVLACL